MTYIRGDPAAVDDGHRHERHDPDADHEVADGQVDDEHRGHRVERFGRCHDHDDEDVTWRTRARTHAHTHTDNLANYYAN